MWSYQSEVAESLSNGGDCEQMDANLTCEAEFCPYITGP